jgi:hypothetical protein
MTEEVRRPAGDRAPSRGDADSQAISPLPEIATSPQARHRRQRPEQVLQRSVIEHLRWRGQSNIFFMHHPAGGWRSPVEAMVLKGLGVTPGVPDILIIRDGKIFGLELKSENGRLTPTQIDCHERMRRAGATVGTAHGIDAALEWLEAHALLKGKTQ